MHITNFVLKAIFSVAVLSLTTLSVAHEGHHSTAQTDGKNVPSMNHQAMSEMDHSQHSPQEHAQHMQMMGKMNHTAHSAPMNHQHAGHQPMHHKSTEKQQDQKVQKGDQHAHH